MVLARYCKWCVFLLALLCFATPAQAAKPIPLKMVAPQPQDHPNSLSLQYLEKLLNEKAPGRFDIAVHIGFALGADVDIARQVRVGTLQMVTNSTANLALLAPNMGVLSLPFIFDTMEEAKVVLDGPFGKKLMDTLEPKGLTGLTFIPIESRQIFNSRVLAKTPEEIKGLKLRVAQASMDVATAEFIGAVGVPLAWTDVYTAIEQKTIDGILVPEVLGFGMRFHEVAKNVTLIDCQPFILIWFANSKWINSLPDDLKPIFIDCVNQARDYQMELMKKAQVDVQEKIVAEGGQITKFPEEARQEFVKTATARWKALCMENKISEGVLEELMAAKKAAASK